MALQIDLDFRYHTPDGHLRLAEAKLTLDGQPVSHLADSLRAAPDSGISPLRWNKGLAALCVLLLRHYSPARRGGAAPFVLSGGPGSLAARLYDAARRDPGDAKDRWFETLFDRARRPALARPVLYAGNNQSHFEVSLGPALRAATVTFSVQGCPVRPETYEARAAGLEAQYASDAPEEEGQPEPALDVGLRLLVWTPATGRYLPAGFPGTLPLDQHSLVRVEATLNAEAHACLIWISSTGQIHPLYRWRDLGSWHLTEAPAPVRRIVLPAQDGEGFPIDTPAGLEALVFLARETPLDANLLRELPEILGPLPRVGAGEVPAEPTFYLGPQLSASNTDGLRLGPPILPPVLANADLSADHPLRRFHGRLDQALGPVFSLIRAVSVPNGTNS